VSGGTSAGRFLRYDEKYNTNNQRADDRLNQQPSYGSALSRVEIR
jgi:hypothetical protein